MYDGYRFEVIVENDGHYPRDHDYPPVPTEAVLGDCWHRFYVRMLEVVQSIDLVRQAMESLRRRHRRLGHADQAERRSCPSARPTWRPRRRGVRWVSCCQRRHGHSLAGPGAKQLLLQFVGDP